MNRRTLAIGGIAAVLVLVLWYLFLWSPRNKSLEDARERRETAESQQAQLRTEIERLRAEQREEPLRRAQLEALRSMIPDEPNLAQFILDTNDAAIRSGIDFLSIAPTPPAAGTALTAPPPPPGAPVTAAPTTTVPAASLPAEVRLSLSIKGGYFQVLDFLNRLDALPRIVVTDGLNVSSEQTASPRLTVAITARMFVRAVPPAFGGPPPTAPGAAPTTAPPGTTP